MSSTPTGPTPKPRRRATAPESEPTPEAVPVPKAVPEAVPEAVRTPEPGSEDTAVTSAEHAPAPRGDLTVDERAELERLRAKVAATQALPQAVAAPEAPPARRGRGRWAGAMVLLLVAALLAPLSAIATWSRATLLDSDKYLAMVAPLASDPAVQEEISRRITDAVFEQLRVKELTTQTLDAIAARPRVEGVAERLPVELSTFSEPISNAIYGFTEEQVSRLVASSAFQDAWVAANREAHASLVAALTGETTDAGVSVSNGQVSVNLAAFIAAIKPVLVERGVPFADRIPTVNARFVVLRSAELGQAQTAIRLLDLLRVVLPVLAILALVAGVALAPARRRALVVGASMVVGSLVLLLLGIQVLRALYLDDLEQVLLVPQVATVLFDTVTTPLRLGVRATAMLFLVIALAAWVAGPSSAAAALRSLPRRLSGSTRRPTGALGSVSRFAAHNTVALRAAVGGLAVLAVLVGDRPSAGGVLLIATLAAVALVVVEVLRRWGGVVGETDAVADETDAVADDAPAPGALV